MNQNRPQSTLSPSSRSCGKSAYSALPAELILNLARDNEPSEDLYAVFVHGLEGLDAWTGDVRTHCAWQVHHILIAAGFGPTLDHCGGCGLPISRATGFTFDSGASCPNCPADSKLSQALWAQLKALGISSDCPRFDLEAGGLRLLARYASHHIERDFRSMRVIDEMIGATNET